MIPSSQILVVEDDATLREGLMLALAKAGYRVLAAYRGLDALKLIREQPVDLVLLDLMLPGLDGTFVLRQAREEGFTMPVIILSARSSVEDKIRGLHIGADDYVTKPFDLEELLARIAARLRRSGDSSLVRFGAVQVDTGARQVMKEGQPVHLTPKEYDLLEFLLKNAGRALGRGKILEEVWGPDYRGTRRTVDNFVRALRIKLEDDPEAPRFFLTIRARGYRFDPRG